LRCARLSIDAGLAASQSYLHKALAARSIGVMALSYHSKPSYRQMMTMCFDCKDFRGKSASTKPHRNLIARSVDRPNTGDLDCVECGRVWTKGRDHWLLKPRTHLQPAPVPLDREPDEGLN